MLFVPSLLVSVFVSLLVSEPLLDELLLSDEDELLELLDPPELLLLEP